MLSKTNRLTTLQLEEVIEKGEVVHTSLFWLKRYKNQDKTKKLSVITPKKIFKTAVTRNKFKRKVYNYTKEIFSKIKEGFNIVLALKEPLLKTENNKIKEELEQIFVKSGLLN